MYVFIFAEGEVLWEGWVSRHGGTDRGKGRMDRGRLRHRKEIRLDIQGHDKIMGFSCHVDYMYERGSEF